MCSHGQGLVRAASGTTLGVLGTSKMKENERFYGFTDFRGKPAKRGGVDADPRIKLPPECSRTLECSASLNAIACIYIRKVVNTDKLECN